MFGRMQKVGIMPPEFLKSLRAEDGNDRERNERDGRNGGPLNRGADGGCSAQIRHCGRRAPDAEREDRPGRRHADQKNR